MNETKSKGDIQELLAPKRIVLGTAWGLQRRRFASEREKQTMHNHFGSPCLHLTQKRNNGRTGDSFREQMVERMNGTDR